MTNWFDYLLRPEVWTEWDIQRAIEHFWPCLFHQYHLCPQYKNTVMPRTWTPDILAAETVSEHGSILIIELKGFPPSSCLDATIDQVIGYGQQYHQEHPGEKIRLTVIGPWGNGRLEPIIRRDGYSVVVLSLQHIGERLISLADGLLMWTAQSPASRAPLLSVEHSILRVSAVTALVPA